MERRIRELNRSTVGLAGLLRVGRHSRPLSDLEGLLAHRERRVGGPWKVRLK
jgi:hypothetical protein